MEANAYLTKKSLRTLRGMTFSGMLYNMLNSETPINELAGKSGSADIRSTLQQQVNTETTLSPDMNSQTVSFRPIDEDLVDVLKSTEDLKK